jgi:hypothetical protein
MLPVAPDSESENITNTKQNKDCSTATIILEKFIMGHVPVPFYLLFTANVSNTETCLTPQIF